MQIINLDTSKYKRLFTFGCSFTQYMWPTWADILGTIVGDYYNYGLSGLGNSAIFYQLVEATKRHSIDKDDLVIIMWTDVFREDRYVKNKWLNLGNIYLQNTHSQEWVGKFACDRGYFIRDMANIEASMRILESIGCDWDFLSMVPMIPQIDEDIEDVVQMYQSNIARFKPSAMDVIFDGDYYSRKNELTYVDYNGKTILDLHPTPVMHMEYVKYIYGMGIPSDVENLVLEHNKLVRSKVNDYRDVTSLPNSNRIQRF